MPRWSCCLLRRALRGAALAAEVSCATAPVCGSFKLVMLSTVCDSADCRGGAIGGRRWHRMEQTAKRFDCYFQQTFRKLPEQVSLLLDSSSSGTIADHVECRETNKEQQWLKIIAIRTSPSRRMARSRPRRRRRARTSPTKHRLPLPNRLQCRTRASGPPPPFLPWTRRMARQAIPLTIRRIMLPLPVNAR